MRRVAIGSLSAVCVILSLVGCGSSKSGTSTEVNGEQPPADAGPDVAPDQALQTGKIVDFDTKKGVEGATVRAVSAAGEVSATTDKSGAYTLIVEKGQPFTMKVSAPNYAQLVEQETTLDANVDRGSSQLIGAQTAGLLLATLDGHDPNLGVLSVDLIPKGSCASEQGATVAVSPAGAAKVEYVAGGFPSHTATSVTKGQFPSAVIYNVQPGVSLTVTVTLAGCTQTAFPVDADGVQYTGGITTDTGTSTSFARIFLQ